MHDHDTKPTLSILDDAELNATAGGTVLGDLWDQVIAPDLQALRDAARWVADQIVH
jgi:hypothetical protein